MSRETEIEHLARLRTTYPSFRITRTEIGFTAVRYTTGQRLVAVTVPELEAKAHRRAQVGEPQVIQGPPRGTPMHAARLRGSTAPLSGPKVAPTPGRAGCCW